MNHDASWLTISERGTVLGIRFLLFVCTALGRGVGRAILQPIALYYALVHVNARRASRRYLERLHARVTFGMIYRHILHFAEASLDRIFLLRGRHEHFEIGSQGFDHLRALRDSRRGAILLGAHLGSFEAMRVLADARELPINILTYTGNARKVNAVLRGLDTKHPPRAIEIDPSSIDSILRVKELVESGQIVAILGDRVAKNDRFATVDFLGGPVRFPTGPYLLAAMLGCPVYLTLGLYRSPNRYEFFCEPFLEKLELPRRDREAGLRAQVQRYAARLEHYCRLAPDNWFNFFDPWAQSDA